MKAYRLIISLPIFAIFLLIATMSFGCYHYQGDSGSGNYSKEDRAVSGFSAIEVGGAFKVFLSQGDQEALAVEADESEIEEIITEVIGNKLKIYMKPGWRGNYHEMSVYITFTSLERIDFSGAVEVVSEGQLNFSDLEMDVSGAAEIDMDFVAQKFEAEFTGASEINFRGSCQSGYIEISGASDFNAEDLEFLDLEIEISGAGDARVFATGNLVIDASGAASVKHKGGAKVSADVSGAANVKAI